MKIKSNKRRALLFAFLFVLPGVFTACGRGYDNSELTPVEGATDKVKIEMEDGGVIVIELYPDIAPITVNNFQRLVSESFYDGVIFHRVIEDFMIQGGDPTGTGGGGSGTNIKGEFKGNGVINNLSHERGVVSMARRGDGNDTASSQFFICHADATYLDGEYAAFGRVTEGMDVVDGIATVKTNSKDKPLQDQVIKTITFAE